jgi:GTPase SAR1 family protein
MPFESFLDVVLGCLRSILKKKTTMTVSDLYEDDFFEIKARETIPEKELNDLKRTIRSKDNFPMEEAKTRNILMVGRCRAGKSTAIGVLKDPCYEPKGMSIFAETVNPKFQSFSLDDKRNGTKYTLSVIDTPGLKEVCRLGENARSDAVILNTINYCLTNEITKINILLIFIAFDIGVSNDDLDSFKTFLQSFGHKGIQIRICITRAESKGEVWKQELLEQLTQHEYFSEVLKSDNVKVLFMGCVDAVKTETISHIDDAKNLYVKVYKMREELIASIFSAEEQVMLVDLPIASGVKSEVKNLFKLQNEILDYLKMCLILAQV